VPTALQDRPTLPSPTRPPARRRGTALLATVVLLGGFVVVGADRALDALSGLGSPFEETVVDRSRPALLQSLSDLDELHAAQGTFQVVVDLERDVRNVPAALAGERTTYLAVGSVDAVLDLGALRSGAVQTEGTTATITLPAPRLDEARLDLDGSRVLDRDRGLLDRVAAAVGDGPASDRAVTRAAQDRLTAAAADSDLLSRAEDNARKLLTDLAGSFGYTDVTVRFEGAPST
jgi:hypothetical protein